MEANMDVMEIIAMMEGTIERASTVPLTGKIMLDRDEMLDFLQELRLVYPEELKEAKWVKEERQRILSEAEARAEAIRKSAEEAQIKLIDEHEVTKEAYRQANETVNAARNQAMDIKTDCDQYVQDMLLDAERRLGMLLNKVKEDRASLNNR